MSLDWVILLKSRKGFIGPIGDDLPSIIPLVFALIVFFSGFYLTMNVFESKQNDFDSDLALSHTIDRLSSLGGFPVIIILSYLTIPYFLVFKPFSVNEDK